MFTGIITNQGTILKRTAASLSVKADTKIVSRLALGGSIAINGVCLTASQLLSNQKFIVEVMPETFKKTMLGQLKINDTVNLELPVKANGLLAGHIVQGHIDNTAVITSIKRAGNSRIFNFTASKTLLDYLVEKGSVAVNGISLTLIKVTAKGFSVGIIPHTWEYTALKSAQAGDKVNIELDILAKYIYKFIKQSKI